MLDFDTAQARLAAAGPTPTRAEPCAVAAARGRILAADVIATCDTPPADNSAMDGYAIRMADYVPDTVLPVQQRCYAGETPPPLQAGKAIRLFTGSLIPPGAQAVIMQEDCIETEVGVQIRAAPQLGQFIRPRGGDVTAGTRLLAGGTRLESAHIALLASQGLRTISVRPRLRVGILTTGDELVAPGQPRQAHQIYNSNAPMLAALLEDLGATPVSIRHVRDEAAALRAAFASLADECGLVLSVGGVSVGERDLVKPALAALGATLDLWKVRMKPGKPVALAHLGDTPVVGLPGNPVSAYVVFALLVTPLIRTMQGRAEPYPPTRHASLRTPKVLFDAREAFIRVQWHNHPDGRAEVVPHANQDSSIVSSLPWAHGLARIPPAQPVSDGDTVRYYDLAHWTR